MSTYWSSRLLSRVLSLEQNLRNGGVFVMIVQNIKLKIRQHIPYFRKIYDGIDALDKLLALEKQKIELLEKDAADREETIGRVRSVVLASEKDGELTDRLLSHPVSQGFPEVSISSRSAKPQPNRIANASRLLRAYDRAINDPNARKYMPQDSSGNMWNEISNTGLSELIRTIESGHPELLAQYLEDFGNSFIWFGGVTTCIDGYNRNLDNRHVALTYWDSLVRISEYLGLHRVENPETGPWGEALYLEPETVVKSIEHYLGISISPPLEVIHTDGLKIGEDLFHYRHTNSLYSAIRLHQISKIAENKPKILEIGGGIGIAALYSNRLGLCDYTLLDIPVTNLLSGSYLLNTLGTEKVSLFGEESSNAEVKIKPFWTSLDMEDKEFNICLNQDSINELDEMTRKSYQGEIPRLTSEYFLSINHECFFPKTAYKLFGDSKRLGLVSRGAYWTRAGYVEELYKILA